VTPTSPASSKEETRTIESKTSERGHLTAQSHASPPNAKPAIRKIGMKTLNDANDKANQTKNTQSNRTAISVPQVAVKSNRDEGRGIVRRGTIGFKSVFRILRDILSYRRFNLWRLIGNRLIQSAAFAATWAELRSILKCETTVITEHRILIVTSAIN
jgi:hypothetical protein